MPESWLEEGDDLRPPELRDATQKDFDMEAFLGYARAVITKTYQLWESLNPDQKRRLQRLIFLRGVAFDGESIRTPRTA